MILPNDKLITPFLRQVQNYPTYPALWVDRKIYTYENLYISAARLAAHIYTASISQCIIFSSRNITAYTGILAALLAGKTYVPLNPKTPLVRNLMLLQQVKVDIMVIDESAFAQAEIFLRSHEQSLTILFPEHVELPDWTQDIQQHHYVNKTEIINSTLLSVKTNKNPNAYLLFTSGSTGIPKGVGVSHCNIIHYLAAIIGHYQPTHMDRFSQITELTFDPSIHDMFVCWSVGACLYVISEKYFINLPGFIHDHQLTFWASMPSTALLLQQLNKNKTLCFPSLRCSIFGGEPLSQRLAAAWQEMAPNSIVENHYGLTETTIGVTAYRWQKKSPLTPLFQRGGMVASDWVPIGKPFSQQAIKIIDEQLNPVAPNTTGELCVSGSQVVHGYWKNSALTRERFIKIADSIWYRTGDFVQWDETDGLIYKGRMDDQLQIRGCRVEKLEIENAVRVAAGTEHVAIVPWLDKQDGIVQAVIAFISNTDRTNHEIKQRCQRLLPHYLIPKEIVLLKNFPFTSNGKIDYKKLTELKNNGGAYVIS